MLTQDTAGLSRPKEVDRLSFHEGLISVSLYPRHIQIQYNPFAFSPPLSPSRSIHRPIRTLSGHMSTSTPTPALITVGSPRPCQSPARDPTPAGNRSPRRSQRAVIPHETSHLPSYRATHDVSRYPFPAGDKIQISTLVPYTTPYGMHYRGNTHHTPPCTSPFHRTSGTVHPNPRDSHRPTAN